MMKSINFGIVSVIFLSFILMPASLTAQYKQDVDWGVHPADFDRVAQSGWQFLKLPTNARQAGLGGVISVLSHGDANSSFTNPAAVPDVENVDVGFSYMNWLVDIGYNSGSVVKNMGSLGTIGVNFIYVDYGDMMRSENQQILDSEGRRTGKTEMALDLGTFTANDKAIGLTYARQISDRLQIGGNFRFIQEQLDDAVTSNWALDIGTVYYTGLKTFRIAMVGRNFGPDVNFAEWDERIQVPPANVKMPMYFTLGGAIDILEENQDPHLLSVAAEFVHPNDGPEKINTGIEYSFRNLAFLRGGYRFNYDEEGFTFGAGLNAGLSSMEVKIDYSYWAFGILGSVNMISVGFSL